MSVVYTPPNSISQNVPPFGSLPSPPLAPVVATNVDGTPVALMTYIGAVVAKAKVMSAVQQATDYSVNDTDFYIPVNAAAGPANIAMPPANQYRNGQGRLLRVARVNSIGGNVTISAALGDNINGLPSIVLTSQFQTADIASNGANTWVAQIA